MLSRVGRWRRREAKMVKGYFVYFGQVISIDLGNPSRDAVRNALATQTKWASLGETVYFRTVAGWHKSTEGGTLPADGSSPALTVPPRVLREAAEHSRLGGGEVFAGL